MTLKMMKNLHIIKGLYAVTPEEKDLFVLSSQVESCIKGGARLIQYRSKTLSKIEQNKQARKIKMVCDYYKVPLIINDDIELCRILDADGVHLGENDDSLEKARLILGPSKIIGVSCYNSIDRVKKAVDKGATYIALGACFPTITKPNAPTASLDLIALVLKGCAEVLKTLAYTSTEMGIESKIGWYACVPLFILAVIFSAFAPKIKI